MNLSASDQSFEDLLFVDQVVLSDHISEVLLYYVHIHAIKSHCH